MLTSSKVVVQATQETLNGHKDTSQLAPIYRKAHFPAPPSSEQGSDSASSRRDDLGSFPHPDLSNS